MKLTELQLIHAEYVAMVDAALAGRSLGVQRMLASQARAEIASAALAAAVRGGRS